MQIYLHRGAGHETRLKTVKTIGNFFMFNITILILGENRVKAYSTYRVTSENIWSIIIAQKKKK